MLPRRKSKNNGRRIAMFDRCSNFTISGSNTFNIINNSAPPVLDEGKVPPYRYLRRPKHGIPSTDFRSIRRGDINLLSCISEEDIVENLIVQHPRRSARTSHVRAVTGRKKMYHARIFRSQDSFTVVAYEQSDFSKNSGTLTMMNSGKPKLKNDNSSVIYVFASNPHLIQLFGMTSSRSMNALIYHDELLPVNLVLCLRPRSFEGGGIDQK
ncbi:hypothetical protein B0H13DRAFT_1896472 [Mycena leptocephala]|nr:hypothetical protein B0H13DRAFT_1896472 [Mycena leptocephala]